MRTASSALLSATGPLWRKSCWSASRCIPSFTHSKRVKFQRRSAPTRSRPEGGGTGSGHTAEPTAAPERSPRKAARPTRSCRQGRQRAKSAAPTSMAAAGEHAPLR